MLYLKRTLILLFFFLVLVTGAFAQPGDPDSDPDQQVPISGLWMLIAGALALGIRSISKRTSKKH